MLVFVPSHLSLIHPRFSSRYPPLHCIANRRRCPLICSISRNIPRAAPPLVLGLNQYSHDASVAIMHASTGEILFALSKERLSRRKHDGGDVALLIKHAVESVATRFNMHIEEILKGVRLVVANNHHFRIAPFEKRLPLLRSLNYVQGDELSPWNLIGREGGIVDGEDRKVELSHHLAHVYSAVCTAPFDEGIAVVMDGMGDALDDWLTSKDDQRYFCELNHGICDDTERFREFPTDIREREGVSFREAESAYVFRREGRKIRMMRVFKRWTPEVEPSELPNHSFEEMESVGAMYSRVSAIVFKDWNSCVQVMGLAPCANRRMSGVREPGSRYFIKGNLYDGSLSVDDGKLKGLEYVDKSWCNAESSPELRRHFEDLAFHVQKDLEDVLTDFISELKHITGENNLVFVGGVALNSTLNGVLSTRNAFDNVFVPPYPGDEGIAVGCAAFGCSHFFEGKQSSGEILRRSGRFMPFLGRIYDKHDIEEAIEVFEPWIISTKTDSSAETARALTESKVVAWFQGSSEFGPRALGNRSILADPRSSAVRDVVNKVVKKRESFRPFAPSVLAEDAHKWFEDCPLDSSPYMSVTKTCTMPDRVQAVVHVDGTSRLQTVIADHNPEYHEMISAFKDLTGIPMVLNTSFNIAGEPIVNSPHDALRTFLAAEGIDLLVFPGIVIQKRDYSVLTKDDAVSSACSTFRSHQVQDCCGASLRTTVVYTPTDINGEDEETSLVGLEYSVELIDSLQLELLEIIHMKGSCQILSILEDMGAIGYTVGNLEQPIAEEVNMPTVNDILDRLHDLFRKRLIFKS